MCSRIRWSNGTSPRSTKTSRIAAFGTIAPCVAYDLEPLLRSQAARQAVPVDGLGVPRRRLRRIQRGREIRAEAPSRRRSGSAAWANLHCIPILHRTRRPVPPFCERSHAIVICFSDRRAEILPTPATMPTSVSALRSFWARMASRAKRISSNVPEPRLVMSRLSGLRR